ncbi:MAG TPA: PQQ-binding-like beta-propeller repeat protein, partial [Ktedonobacterales bacterium]|nr:PQQ-binding-like beta-propeller repeat protein [Ktedonobacterales bacterium]
MKRRLIRIALGCLLLLGLAGCGYQTMTGIVNGQSHEIALRNCPDHPPSVSATTPLPTSTAHTIYVGSGDNLYALSATNGATLWCRQIIITGQFSCPASQSCPPGPFVYWGQPAVADGVVYVCASGYGSGLTYAFRASDGGLLWRAMSDCQAVSTPFGDNAIPLVDHGVVYSGLHALRARDGRTIWTTTAAAKDPRYISFQALVDGVLYGNDEDSIYAVNSHDGSVRWRYTAPDKAPPGGSLVVADGRVYYGTLDSVDGSEKSALYVLDAATGTLVWRFSMGAYAGATIANNLIYVSSRDQFLYALQTSDGAIRWRNRFSIPVYNTAVSANGVIYITLNGA